MEIRIFSIKEFKDKIKDINADNVKFILVSSYDDDIESISYDNKLVLHFDDICIKSKSSFNSDLAHQIACFVNCIDFDKYQLYVCCDSGISRSSAIVAAILRRFGMDEYLIWREPCYSPNMLVYRLLCKEFKLINIPFSLKHKELTSKNALRKSIKALRGTYYYNANSSSKVKH